MPPNTLVLLPGLDGTGTLFTDFISELPSALRVKIVTYPTHRFLSYSELRPVVEESIGTSRPFVLVAESFSTPLAAMVAGKRPPNLAGLVMCAGFVSNPLGGWSKLVRALARPLLFRISQPRFALEHFLIGAGSPHLLETRVRRALRVVSPDVLARRVRAVLDCDAREELARTNVPIMYIQGRDDRLVGERCFREIRRLRPDTVLASVPGPHLVFQMQPQETAKAIVEFIGFGAAPTPALTG